MKAAPYVDVVGMAIAPGQRHEPGRQLVAGHGTTTSTAESRTGTRPRAGFWQRLWREGKRDVRDLIRIQNVEKPEVPLLSPDQAFFLRENLKLRLLGARLALLAHDEASFKADLKAASGWLTHYYDGADKTVAAAQSTLKQLVQSDIGIQMPDISASLDAARNFKLVRERSAR